MAAAERRPLLGVVLAGGAARRLGGDKAGVVLLGRPLVAWVATALRAVAGDVVVTAKEGATVPALDGVEVWREPVEPVHPLAGIASALSRAAGRDVLVCAVDLPFCAEAVRAVVAGAYAEIASEPPQAGGRAAAPIVIAEGQPLLGVYRAGVTDELRAAVGAGRAAREVVASLGAVAVTVPDPDRTLFNVNTPEDLAWAKAMASGG